MSKWTPRVSALEAAFIAEPIKYSTSHKMAVWDLARQLEAENAELRAALESAIDIIGHPDDSFTQYARALLAKVEGE